MKRKKDNKTFELDYDLPLTYEELGDFMENCKEKLLSEFKDLNLHIFLTEIDVLWDCDKNGDGVFVVILFERDYSQKELKANARKRESAKKAAERKKEKLKQKELKELERLKKKYSNE